MNVVYDYPPNYSAIITVFPDVITREGVIFTYGDTIYSPVVQDIPEHLHVHEMVHMQQQGDNPEGWWDQYLVDEEFRLDQEVEAYHEQYESVKDRMESTILQMQFLMVIAQDLSSSMYGNIVSLPDAVQLIQGS